MRARGSLVWHVAMAMAFGATAVLAVTLSRATPVNAALTSAGTGATHAVSPAQAAGTARCAAAGLRLSLGPGARLTTVTTRYQLEFTNVSGVPCAVAGYPRVAAYRGDGVQVGPAADDTSVVVRLVLLARGQTAHAVLDASVPAPRCRPVRVSGLRVVTPGETTVRYVRRPLTTCVARGAARGQNYLLVSAIQPGAGSGGGTGTVAGARPSPRSARQALPAT